MSENAGLEEVKSKLEELSGREGSTAQEWLDALESALKAGLSGVTGEWAEMAQAAQAKQGKVDDGLTLLEWRAAHTPATSSTPDFWLNAASRVAAGNARLNVLKIEAGFGRPLSPRECVRRFKLLHALHMGAFCWHNVWGFGVVAKSDDQTRTVVVDFTMKPGCKMPMANVVQSMNLLPEDHLLVQNYLDPEAMARRVQEDPASVVRDAVACLPPMTAKQLQERLVKSGIVDASEWKGFWDAARKALKKDGTVIIPAKAAETLRKAEGDGTAAHGGAWFVQLARDCDLKDVLAKMRELTVPDDSGAMELQKLAGDNRRIVANRVAFVIRGATRDQHSFRLQAVVLAAQMDLAETECPWRKIVAGLLEEKSYTLWVDGQKQEKDYLVEGLHALPARDIAPFLRFLDRQNPELLRSRLLEVLKQLHYTPLNEALKLLAEVGLGEECRKVFAQEIAGRRMCQEMLLWGLKNLKKMDEWDLLNPEVLASMVVDELEQSYMGERLKTQKDLRKHFEENELLKSVFDSMTMTRRVDFFKRINRSSAWRGLDRQGIQAKVIKLYPELQPVVTGEAAGAAAAAALLTSPRSFREREEQLNKLINEDIPANAREIAVARSYGDLRENFEYKAAKEMQTVLYARRDDLMAQMAKVRPSDFADLPKDVAGMGTSVRLGYADGHEEVYHILGEWDHDDGLKIISSMTRLAKAVAGHVAGDEVDAPAGDGRTVKCRVVSVSALPQEIVDWMK